jgi:hypothetical protein
MIEKEAVDSTFKNHDPHILVVLNLSHDFPELQNKFRTHEVERRVVKYHSPIGRRLPIYMYLLSLSCRIHRGHLSEPNAILPSPSRSIILAPADLD